MGLYLDSRFRAEDANGDPLSGALLLVYEAGTTTPADVWANAAQDVPLTNPVEADSSGRFPQIFGPEGTLVDMTLKTAGGSTVASYLSVPCLGADTGDITRDFTDSRFTVRGSGGTVYIEAGDPVGDEIGGEMSLGGRAGSQADAITLNGALVDVTGRLKENGKKIPASVYTDATAFSGATVSVALPNDPTGALAYQVEFWGVVTTGAANIYARLGYGGAVKSGASDYAWCGWRDAGTTLSVDAVSTHRDNLDAQIVTNEYAITGTATYPLRMTVEIITVASGSGSTTVRGGLTGSGGTYPQVGGFSGYGLGGYGRATVLELSLNAGSFTSGFYHVKPLRAFGET